VRIAKIIALIGVLAMGSALIYGFAVGDFSGEGNALLRMPWGIVSLVDVYTGVVLFSCWVVFRERSVPRSAIWIVLVIVLGFFAAALYTLVALISSDGSWERFFLGRRASVEAREGDPQRDRT
jgi:hypothetical protein